MGSRDPLVSGNILEDFPTVSNIGKMNNPYALHDSDTVLMFFVRSTSSFRREFSSRILFSCASDILIIFDADADTMPITILFPQELLKSTFVTKMLLHGAYR